MNYEDADGRRAVEVFNAGLFPSMPQGRGRSDPLFLTKLKDMPWGFPPKKRSPEPLLSVFSAPSQNQRRYVVRYTTANRHADHSYIPETPRSTYLDVYGGRCAPDLIPRAKCLTIKAILAS